MPDEDQIQPLARKRPFGAPALPMPEMLPEDAQQREPMSKGFSFSPSTPPNPYDDAVRQGLILGTPATPNLPPPTAQPPALGHKPYFTEAENRIQNPFLRTLAKVGDVAGSALFPGVTSMVPGTRLNEERQQGIDLGRQKEQAGIEHEQAESGELGARGEWERAHAKEISNPKLGQTPEEVTIHDLMTGENGQPRINPDTQKPYTYLEAYSAVKKAAQEGKPAKGMTQEENKLQFQGVIGKLDAAGLSTDPKILDKSLDAGLKRGVISPEEHATARAYQAANSTPGTNFTVHVEGQQAGQNLKDQNAKALIDDGNGGTKIGTVAEAKTSGAEYIPVKDEQTVVNTGRLYNQIRRSTDRLADPRLLKIFDDPAARAIIATATSEQEAARQVGAMLPGIGGIMIPVPQGIGKFIDSVLQNYKGTNKKELQEYLANYWEAREAAMNMMRLQTEGKQGARSQTQMSAIVAQLPGGQTPNKDMAALQLRNMFANLDDYGRGVPDKLPGYEKYKAIDYSKQHASNTEQTNAPPKVGDVIDGYRFKGGDPSKKENWELPKQP